MIANVMYQTANLYYESMLPYICDTKKRAKVSAFGVAFGYLGTIFAVILVFVLPIVFGDATETDDVINGVVSPENIELNWVFWMFIFAAICYFLISIPFLWVKESQLEEEKKDPFGVRVKSTFVQLGRTMKEIFTQNRDMVLFLFGWFLINDALLE
jgi:UMF1 family MFS transporter